jgi:hypothetical protein
MFSSWFNTVPDEEVPADDKLPKALSAKKLCEEKFQGQYRSHVLPWDFFADKKTIWRLNNGDVLFAFKTAVGNFLGDEEKHVVSHLVNLSGFADETKENNVPNIDIYNEEEAAKYTFIITKVTYLLPDVPLDVLTPTALSNRDYHRRCQPGSPTIYDGLADDRTFRMTKTIIPLVFKITIQLRASHLTNKDDLKHVEDLCPSKANKVDKAILMERTKKNIQVLDATRKAKSLLLYTRVEGGLLCQHYTVVINVSIPTFAAPVFNNFASFGAAEGLETANLTRNAFLHYAKNDYKVLTTPQDPVSDDEAGGRPRADSGY